jgi:ferredoxin
VFELQDDGYAVVRIIEVPKEFEEAVRTAVNQCPSGAISIGK